MSHIIYCHRNKINDKVYIGQTKLSVKRRARNDGSGYKGCHIFWNAIQKYGWDSFETIILENNLSDEEVDERECYWIKKFNSQNPEYGYNTTKGGKETYNKKELGYKRGIYCKETGQYFESLSDAAEWAGLSRTSMSQISMVASKKYYCTAGHHPITKEPLHWCFTKEELDTPNRERNPARSRRVRNIETGKIFNTLKEAGQWAGLTNGSHIIDCLKGKAKSAGKHPITKERLHWEEVD